MAPEKGPEKYKEAPKENDKKSKNTKETRKPFLEALMKLAVEKEKVKGNRMMTESMKKLADSAIVGDLIDLLKDKRAVEAMKHGFDNLEQLGVKIDRNNKKAQLGLLLEAHLLGMQLSPEMTARFEKGEINRFDILKMFLDKRFATKLNTLSGEQLTKWKGIEGTYRAILDGVEKSEKDKEQKEQQPKKA
jgi:hypothetical protein